MISTDVEYGQVVITRTIEGNRVIYDYALDPPDLEYVYVSDTLTHDFCDCDIIDDTIHFGPFILEIFRYLPHAYICRVIRGDSD